MWWTKKKNPDCPCLTLHGLREVYRDSRSFYWTVGRWEVLGKPMKNQRPDWERENRNVWKLWCEWTVGSTSSNGRCQPITLTRPGRTKTLGSHWLRSHMILCSRDQMGLYCSLWVSGSQWWWFLSEHFRICEVWPSYGWRGDGGVDVTSQPVCVSKKQNVYRV